MISIIIPTLNEEACLEKVLQNVDDLREECDIELIVADGGSDDRTVEIARRYARVVQTGRGRALQLNAAAKVAKGDILFFVHADMNVPKGALKIISEKVLQENYHGGGFSNTFTSHNKKIKRLGRLLNIRIFDNDRPSNTVFFGDNGIFVRRSSFNALKGFKPIPIMEDYDFSRRMKERFKVVRVVEPRLGVSPRRHERSGFVRTRLQWITIKWLYLLGVSPHTLTRLYSDVR